MSGFLANRWLSIVVRLFLGSVFIYSAWPKLSDPPAFAHAIWNYRILPSLMINPLALLIPWLELIAGVALITGVLRRGAALGVTLMLAVFISGLALNVYRDIPVDCGCFSLGAEGKSHDELMSAMKVDILRDIGFLVLGLHALFAPITWLRTESSN